MIKYSREIIVRRQIYVVKNIKIEFLNMNKFI